MFSFFDSIRFVFKIQYIILVCKRASHPYFLSEGEDFLQSLSLCVQRVPTLFFSMRQTASLPKSFLCSSPRRKTFAKPFPLCAARYCLHFCLCNRRLPFPNRSLFLSEGEGRSAANALSKPMQRRTPTGFHDLPLKVAPTLSALFGLPSRTQTLFRCLRPAVSPVRAGFLPRRPLLDGRRIPSRGVLTTARLVTERYQTIYPSIRW
jgi:hypothetical protein